MNIRLWLLGQFKKKPRIYIMPTAMGGYLNGLIFLMFFLAVGYNNNLLLIFTLFLFGLNLIWVIQTHFHLHALKLQSVTIKDGHVGENICAQVYWKSVPEGPYCWELSLEKEDGQSLDLKSLSYGPKSLEGQVIFNQRGIWSIGHLKIKSQMPFGLYRAWIYLFKNRHDGLCLP